MIKSNIRDDPTDESGAMKEDEPEKTEDIWHSIEEVEELIQFDKKHATEENLSVHGQLLIGFLGLVELAVDDDNDDDRSSSVNRSLTFRS